MGSEDSTVDDFRPHTDRLIESNGAYAELFHNSDLQVRPTLQIAVVACMDSRMDIFQILGLQHGQAHVIRNAGGVITDDVVRSVFLSQRAMGTREVVLLHHTNCGLEKLDAMGLRRELEETTGVRPAWTFESFESPYDDVRQSIRRLQLSPFIPHKDHIRGFVYDVVTGRLQEVELASS
ncbi:MAG: carbonic anhydrase [Actinomycetia bacterium]|nr:carbonic anhydrase [Actinomycetes bacterium]MCP4963150.1 carbonic anhydrase [Actinomycetes bacterium]